MTNEAVPNGWVAATLADITAPSREMASPQSCGDLPFLGMDGVEAQSMRLLATVPATTMKSAAARFAVGDVLYGRLRPYLNKVLHAGLDGLCSSEFIVFPKRATLDNGFLAYRLNAADYVRFSSHLNAGDRPRVYWDQIGVFPILLPPLPEQRRIVEKIEELFSMLDAGVAALERVRANLKRYRASVLKAAVEGRLTEEWRAKHPDTEPASVLLDRILHERRRQWEEDQLAKFAENGQRPPAKWQGKYKEPASDTTAAVDPPTLPDGWVYTPIRPLLPNDRAGMKTGPFGSLLKKHEHRASGVPVLGIENIDAMRFRHGSKIHITAAKAQQLKDYDAQPGDIIISRSGTVGEVCAVPEGLGDARISTNLMRVRLAPGGLLPQFLCLMLQGSPFVDQQIHELCSGSTRDFLNQAILSKLLLPLPPLAEQTEIIAEVERRLSVVDEIEMETTTGLKRAARLRQSILKRAFEGRLVPQDPNDEPASVLLERIRTQRQQGASLSSPTRRRRSSGTSNPAGDA